MNPQQTQQPNPQPQKPQMTADQAASHLGFVTSMHEQLLQYKAKKTGVHQGQSQTTPQASQEPQGEEQGEKDDLMAGIQKLIEPLAQKLDALEQEVKKPSDNQGEIDAIRAELDKLEQNG